MCEGHVFPATHQSFVPFLRYGNDQTYFEEIKQFYYRDEFSHQVQEWNRQRTMAIERALQQFLYVQMAKELKNKLLAEARESVVKVRPASHCLTPLWGWAQIFNLRTLPHSPSPKLHNNFSLFINYKCGYVHEHV